MRVERNAKVRVWESKTLPEEVHHDSLVQTVESRISHAGAVALERARDHLVFVLVIHVETEDVSSESVVHSVEMSVARIHVAFDQICEDAETFGGINVDLLAALIEHVAKIDSVHDTQFQGLDLL